MNTRRFKVTLEYRIRQTVEVEAPLTATESEVESLAMEEVEISPVYAEHMDTRIKEITP